MKPVTIAALVLGYSALACASVRRAEAVPATPEFAKRACVSTKCKCTGIPNGLFCGDGVLNCIKGHVYQCGGDGKLSCDFGVRNSCKTCGALEC